MKLTKEESEILNDFEEGKLVPSVTDKQYLQRFVDGAKKFDKKTLTYITKKIGDSKAYHTKYKSNVPVAAFG